MGTLQRISMMIRSNLDDMIRRAEDPGRMLDQAVLDMRAQRGQAQAQVAVAIADEHRVRRERDAHLQAASGWERRAMLALETGNEGLAREALTRKTQHDETAATWHAHWVQHKQGVDALRAALTALAHKIDHADRQRRLLAARAARAHAQMSIARTLSAIDGASPLTTLQRMEDRVTQLEAQAEAQTELVAGPDAGLEAQFRALESSQAVDDQLAALKRRMALPAGPAPRPLPN